MSASFHSALIAAREASSSQHYPEGTLYVVATPIGNLADITLRGLHVLQIAQTIACEDTRHTLAMLRAYGIEKSAGSMLAVHQHNESEAAQKVIALLREGQRVAFVSDAGTPAVSDPGARLVAQVRKEDLRVVPLPGASSVTAALSVSGISDEKMQGSLFAGFLFAGFLPSKSTERSHAVETLAHEKRAVVLLEAPHRIDELAKALAVLDERQITICRELTKQFEEIATISCADFPVWLDADSNRSRGEFALVLHPFSQADDQTDAEGERVLKLLMPELPLKTAAKLAAQISKASRNDLYALGLQLKGD